MLEQAPEEGAALGAARRRREEPVRAPFLLVQVDERVEVAERVGRTLQAHLAGCFGAPDLSANLVALLLAEPPEVALEVKAGHEVVFGVRDSLILIEELKNDFCGRWL